MRRAIPDHRHLEGMGEAQQYAYLAKFHELADPFVTTIGGVPQPRWDVAHRAGMAAAFAAGVQAPVAAKPAARTTAPERGDGTITVAAGSLPPRSRAGSIHDYLKVETLMKPKALITKTEAAIATETDPSTLRVLQSKLGAYQAQAEMDDDGDDDDDDEPDKRKPDDDDDDDRTVRCGSPGCGVRSPKSARYCSRCGATLGASKARKVDEAATDAALAEGLEKMAAHFSGHAPRPGAPVMAALPARHEGFAPLVLERPRSGSALERENELLSHSPHHAAPEFRRR